MNETEIEFTRIPTLPQQTPVKKDLKRTINYLVGGLLIYELIMFVSMIIYVISRMLLLFLSSRSFNDAMNNTEEITASLVQSGTPYLIALTLGIPLILLYYWCIHPSKIKKLFQINKVMNKKIFLYMVIITMSGQALFTIIGGIIESIFNLMGFSVLKALEDIPQTSTFSMFLYISFLGPITEELIFRGILLQRLARFGKLFAIVITSLLFGAFHGNFIQGIFAAYIGLIYGYVALEYSIKWSILLHIINNFIFCELFTLLTKNFRPSTQNILSFLIFGAFLVGTILLLLLYRRQIADYIKEHTTTKGFYRYTFTSWVMILFLIVQLVMCIFTIDSI